MNGSRCGSVASLLRRFTVLDGRAYTTLLELRDDYSVAEIDVDPTSWLAQTAIEDLNPTDEGVVVLGVVRPDRAAPRG